jgi:hypothetical protein
MPPVPFDHAAEISTVPIRHGAHQTGDKPSPRPPASSRQLIFLCRQDAGGPSRGIARRRAGATKSALVPGTIALQWLKVSAYARYAGEGAPARAYDPWDCRRVHRGSERASRLEDRPGLSRTSRAYLRPRGLICGRVARLCEKVGSSAHQAPGLWKKQARALTEPADFLAESRDRAANQPARSCRLSVCSQSPGARSQTSPRSHRVGSSSRKVPGLREKQARALAPSPRFLTSSRDSGKNEPTRWRGRLTSSRSPGTLRKMSPRAGDVRSSAQEVSGLCRKQGDAAINKPARY